MCVLVRCSSCGFIKLISCILRCYFPSTIIVLCILCSQTWKYISYKGSKENKMNIKNLPKMKYNDQGKLIYSAYDGKDFVIIDYYEDIFYHYIPVLVLVKDYFKHIIQKWIKEML